MHTGAFLEKQISAIFKGPHEIHTSGRTSKLKLTVMVLQTKPRKFKLF